MLPFFILNATSRATVAFTLRIYQKKNCKKLKLDIEKKLCYNDSATKIGVSPSGKAKDFDSFIRWFKSSYPCQTKPLFREWLCCLAGVTPLLKQSLYAKCAYIITLLRAFSCGLIKRIIKLDKKIPSIAFAFDGIFCPTRLM